MNLQSWIGRSETANDVVTPTPYAALSATLDRAAERPVDGTPLPALWHWLYFLPLYRESDVGPDGHARRGGFLPPVPLPRRMWAGSDFEFREKLRVGDAVRRISTIENIDQRTGRSGPLTFVKVRHEIGRDGASQAAIVETHDIVYREAPKPGDAPIARPAPERATWEQEIVPDDVLLFRYSALTFNSHRIHYDRRYVTATEGYPGLVVHGPLIATLLVELLRTRMPEATLSRFAFRALSPLFDIEPFFVCGEPGADASVRLWAKNPRGGLAMDATATLT